MDLFDEWNGEAKDFLKSGCRNASYLGGVIVIALAQPLLGWKVQAYYLNNSNVIFVYVAALLALSGLVYMNYLQWRNPTEPTPIWFYGSRNAAFVGASASGLLLGVIVTSVCLAVGSQIVTNYGFRLGAGVLLLAIGYWFCGKIALIAARYWVDRNALLQVWIG